MIKITRILMIVAMLAFAVVGFAACDASISARSSPSVAEKAAPNTIHADQGAIRAAFGTDEVQAPAVAKLPQYDVREDLVIGQPERPYSVRQAVGSMPLEYAIYDKPNRTAALDGHLTAQLKPKLSHTGVDHARAREKV